MYVVDSTILYWVVEIGKSWRDNQILSFCCCPNSSKGIREGSLVRKESWTELVPTIETRDSR